MNIDHTRLLSEDALSKLYEYACSHNDEGDILTRFYKLLRKASDPFSPQRTGGHITASAVVVADVSAAVLMVYHSKLARWLQPGGHVEVHVDKSIPHAAARECLEETGIDPLNSIAQPNLIDLDIHTIPASASFQCHEHFDMRIFFLVSPHVLSRDDVRWMPIDELAAAPDESLSGFARKGKRLLTSVATHSREIPN